MYHNRLRLRAASARDVVETRAISVRPNSFDSNARTFTAAVLATSRPIRVRGGVMESLDLTAAQLPESLPLLLDHRSDVRSTVGRVTNLRVQGDELLGDGTLTSDTSIDWLVSRIADGTAGGLSVGYSIERSREGAGRARTIVPAFDHVGIVAQPADRRAGIRSSDFSDDDDDDRGDRRDARERNGRIRSLCRTLGISRQIEERAIDKSWSDTEIMDSLLDRQGGSIRATRNHVTLDDPVTFRNAAVDSLVARMSGQEPQGPARELASLSWPDFHRRVLRNAGQSVTGLSDQEVIIRALSTSDLPLIAGESYNLNMRRVYEASLSPSAMLAGARSVPDFRVHTEALADWTTLGVDKVNELGEFKSSFVSEDGETYKVFTLGGITAISRQVWVNSAGRLGSLSDAMGRRMAADVSDRRVAYLEGTANAGPVMRDGQAVFYSGRGNIATLDITSFTTIIDSALLARAAASKRKGQGDVMIGQAPTVWLVPPEFEGDAIRAVANVAAVEASNVNPLSGRLTVVSEPRLSETDHSYLACMPSAFDGLVQVSMDGTPGVYTESRWGFERDALEIKARLDIGFGWIEHRSWTRLDHSEVSP